MPSSQQGHDDTPSPIFCVQQHQEHCSSGPSIVLFEKCWVPSLVPAKTKMGTSSIGVLGICGVMPVAAVVPLFPTGTRMKIHYDTYIKLKNRHVPTKTATRTDEPPCSDVKLPVRRPALRPPPPSPSPCFCSNSQVERAGCFPERPDVGIGQQRASVSSDGLPLGAQSGDPVAL